MDERNPSGSLSWWLVATHATLVAGVLLGLGVLLLEQHASALREVAPDDLERSLAAMRGSLFSVGALAFGAALGLGFWTARRVSAPLRHLGRAADAIGRGDYRRSAHSSRFEEIADLERALDRLGGSVARRIDAMSEDRGQLRAMLAGMKEGVIAVDREDDIVFSNGAAHELLQSPKPNAAGTKIWEVTRLPELLALLEAAKQGGVEGEITIPSEAGPLAVAVQATPFSGGRMRGVICVLHDQTELRRLERVRRDFVANVSHELKTPLTSIRGYVETLLESQRLDPERQQRFLTKVAANAERLEKLVGDLLELARVQNPERPEDGEEVDLAVALRDSFARRELAMAERRLDARLEIAAEGLCVWAAPESLRRVFDNLLDNAIKYSHEGGRIRVALEAEAERLRVSVTDEGRGIPSVDLDRIFERFYRVDRARTAGPPGSGIGLSIVRNLVESMQGRVRATSTLGVGSKFVVELPRSLRDSEDP